VEDIVCFLHLDDFQGYCGSMVAGGLLEIA